MEFEINIESTIELAKRSKEIANICSAIECCFACETVFVTDETTISDFFKHDGEDELRMKFLNQALGLVVTGSDSLIDLADQSYLMFYVGDPV